jgi:hypothetical protein
VVFARFFFSRGGLLLFRLFIFLFGVFFLKFRIGWREREFKLIIFRCELFFFHRIFYYMFGVQIILTYFFPFFFANSNFLVNFLD